MCMEDRQTVSACVYERQTDRQTDRQRELTETCLPHYKTLSTRRNTNHETFSDKGPFAKLNLSNAVELL